jgi:hypothetical protein
VDATKDINNYIFFHDIVIQKMSLSYAPYTCTKVSVEANIKHQLLQQQQKQLWQQPQQRQPQQQQQHGSQSLCFPSPFSPYGGSVEFNSNDLLLKDAELRKLANVSPLDCGITALYWLNPNNKL